MSIPAIDEVTRRPRYPEVTAAGALKVTGGGAGGGGDASATNQTTQIAAAHLTNARLPGATTATLVNATVGAAFAPLPAGACRALFVNNNRPGAVDLEWRRGGAGGAEIISVNSWRLIDAITDGAQIQMHRSDGLAPTVVVSVEYRT